MTVYHEEEPITTIINGKKFTIYKDSWTEHLDDINCPCCNKPMQYFETKDQRSQGVLDTFFHLSCTDCSLRFSGLNDYYVFRSREDFLKFCIDRINLRSKNEN